MIDATKTAIPNSKDIGKHLKTLRQSKQLKQKEVALNAGMQASFLSTIERGEKDLKVSTVERILVALDARWSDLDNVRAAR